MSEPVIKAKAWHCAKCHGTPGEWHFQHADDVVLQPLYTRDDLVRVALEGLLTRWNGMTEQQQAEHLVDRLTKGET